MGIRIDRASNYDTPRTSPGAMHHELNTISTYQMRNFSASDFFLQAIVLVSPFLNNTTSRVRPAALCYGWLVLRCMLVHVDVYLSQGIGLLVERSTTYM